MLWEGFSISVHKSLMFTRFSGGLGNQIYGLCTAWLISEIANVKILLSDATVDNPQYTNRVFNIFEIDFTNVVQDRISRKRLWPAFDLLFRALSKVARKKWIPGEVEFDENAELIAGSIRFLTQIRCDSRLAAKARARGFPTTVRLKDPSAEYKMLLSETLNTRVLAVHLRLTDIRSFESGNRMLNQDYFARNIERITSRDSIEAVWVFSDEPDAIPEFLPAHLKVRSISSSYSLTACEELVLMSQCDALLGSRSTFSFWASFWNSNQERIYYPGPVAGFELWHDSLI
jgi:hypothetical protein